MYWRSVVGLTSRTWEIRLRDCFFGLFRWHFDTTNWRLNRANGPLMTSSKSVEQRLAAAAKKARRDSDSLQAVRDYAAEKARVDANTLRLRALRLEKEAAEASTAAELATPQKAAVGAPKRAHPRKRPGMSV
jgi:hypothetical protein